MFSKFRVIRLPNGLIALLISSREERDDTSNTKDECSNDSSVEQIDTDDWQVQIRAGLTCILGYIPCANFFYIIFYI